MIRKISQVLTVAVSLFSLTSALPPVDELSFTSAALDYSGLWRGATITRNTVGAHENIQMLSIRYAPLPYCMVSAGLGASQFSTDSHDKKQFKGSFGVSPSFGVFLFSPDLFNFVRVTLGSSAYYLYNTNKDKSYIYKGLIASPQGGLAFSITDAATIEAGSRALAIFGEMQKKTDTGTTGFSNNNRIRGYISLSLKTPSEGGYCILDFDASPTISADWSKGPFEASIGITIGTIIRAKRKSTSGSGSPPNFPEFEGMKEQQKKMQEEIK